MGEVSVSEAKSRLDDLVGEVERGHQVVITREGRPVARLVPAMAVAGAESLSRAQAAADALRELSASIAAQGESVSRDELIAFKNEGRP
jgi:prevent-host-death family protein